MEKLRDRRTEVSGRSHEPDRGERRASICQEAQKQIQGEMRVCCWIIRTVVLLRVTVADLVPSAFFLPNGSLDNV